MKIHFKIILLTCISILIIGCTNKMRSDLWDGKYSKERSYKQTQRRAIKLNCVQYMGTVEEREQYTKQGYYPKDTFPKEYDDCIDAAILGKPYP